jgi:hypothetical protein
VHRILTICHKKRTQTPNSKAFGTDDNPDAMNQEGRA